MDKIKVVEELYLEEDIIIITKRSFSTFKEYEIWKRIGKWNESVDVIIQKPKQIPKEPTK